MKKIIYFLVVVSVLVSVSVWQYKNFKKLEAERDIFANNSETFLLGMHKYKTKDSLNAVQVGELSLRLSEFKKYRSQDSKLIESLQIKNRDLKTVSSNQLKTIQFLKGNVKDSVVFIEGDTVIINCVKINDPWFDFNGCISGGSFIGEFENRDSLIYIETVKYKRFLGFLWKTKAIKDRKQDLISKNPNTVIVGSEFITIRSK